MKPLYDQARERVENSLALVEYADIILYDWPEGDEHWQWVIDTEEGEILSWAQHLVRSGARDA